MLYGLSVEGKMSTSDISIQGRLEGVHARDISPAGKKYSEILTIGTGEETHPLQPAHCLSFSLNRSSQSSVSLSEPSHTGHSDVHLTVFVPAIHYIHSVNFVYEIEVFVSDFVKYFTSAMASTFKSAAVGVAKGLVRQESQLAESLSRLHSSFGHAETPSPDPSEADKVVGPREETDTGLPFQFGGSKLYFDISVQSPVIVLPTSLSKEDCLVAHLGEITVSNEYLSYSSSEQGSGSELTASVYHSTPPSVERVMLSVSNISLHATHTRESRLKLESFQPDQTYPEHCCKVLREISMEFQIDKQLAPRNTSTGCGGQRDVDADVTFDSEAGKDADLSISGRVCDPLLIELPKAVFDQLKTTLKHGIRRKPRRKSRGPQFSRKEGSKKVYGASREANRTVQFDPVVQVHEPPADKHFPTIFASFSLPKLSLELKHVIDHQDRNLVYVSLDDLSVQYEQRDIDYLSVDLALKSIIIEDLLQPEDSEFRNILASSSKPLPFPLSPVPQARKVLRNITSIPSPLAQHIFPLSHLMSTPKPAHTDTNHSPLRSFSSCSDRKDSSSKADDTRSTVKEESSTFSETCTDLLTVRAFYVNKSHPQFVEKYDSVSENSFSNIFACMKCLDLHGSM
jgi:vacuolar protein sorting-associated protein 13D